MEMQGSVSICSDRLTRRNAWNLNDYHEVFEEDSGVTLQYCGNNYVSKKSLRENLPVWEILSKRVKFDLRP